MATCRKWLRLAQANWPRHRESTPFGFLSELGQMPKPITCPPCGLPHAVCDPLLCTMQVPLGLAENCCNCNTMVPNGGHCGACLHSFSCKSTHQEPSRLLVPRAWPLATFSVACTTHTPPARAPTCRKFRCPRGIGGHAADPIRENAKIRAGKSLVRFRV